MLTDIEDRLLALVGVIAHDQIAACLGVSPAEVARLEASIREKLAIAPGRDLRDVVAAREVGFDQAATEAASRFMEMRPAWERRAALLFARALVLQAAEHLGAAPNTALLLAQLAAEQR